MGWIPLGLCRQNVCLPSMAVRVYLAVIHDLALVIADRFPEHDRLAPEKLERHGVANGQRGLTRNAFEIDSPHGLVVTTL